MNSLKIENIMKVFARKVHEFVAWLKKIFEPIIKFCMSHKKLVIKFINSEGKKNRYLKYLKRVRNRQALYNRRRALGKVR